MTRRQVPQDLILASHCDLVQEVKNCDYKRKTKKWGFQSGKKRLKRKGNKEVSLRDASDHNNWGLGKMYISQYKKEIAKPKKRPAWLSSNVKAIVKVKKVPATTTKQHKFWQKK